MVYMMIMAVLVALFYLTRFYYLKKEIRNAARQLNELNNQMTAKKINLAFFDKDLEVLSKGINEQIDKTRWANAEKKRTENELRLAIANISHDIRTPMTSILGYMQLLESEELTPEKRAEYIAIVKKGALRLKALLEDFFELSIIESFDYPLKIETIKLNNIVLEALVGFYEQFNQKGLEPIIEIPAYEIRLKADPSAVKRVIENLILNSIKHSSGNVLIRLERLQSGIQLIICNPAPHLKEEDLLLLFDRFYKADQTRTEKSTGLGLSIAKSLMLKMNGKLTAELKDNQLYMKCEWKN